MNLIDIRSQIEQELTWRQNELRFFRNRLSDIPDPNDKMVYRKALVVMLYSHYEGFCKMLFLIYVNAINLETIPREAANCFISTASMASVFDMYDDGRKKCDWFRSSAPDDAKIHKFARQVDLVKNLREHSVATVMIPDSVVDTESNLWPVVLRKILFRLGFQHDCFQDNEGAIFNLLNRRNSIAHGTQKEGLSEQQYEELERSINGVMHRLGELVYEGLQNGIYLSEQSETA